jgi:cell division protein FtsB
MIIYYFIYYVINCIMKQIIFIVVLIISLFVINNLVHSIYSLWQKQDLLTSAQKDLEREKTLNKHLRDDLANVRQPGFIEKQARDRLLLVKPGEDIVLLDHELIAGSPSAAPKPTPHTPNWQQWWNLFFKPK